MSLQRTRLDALANLTETAQIAAGIIAERSRAAFKERGRFTIALSGGTSTLQMIHYWGREEVPWGKVFVFEVNEPIPLSGLPAVHFPKLREAFVEDTPIDPRQIHPMPVSSRNPRVATRSYARKIERFAGSPPVIDLVYLDLETDGCALKLVVEDPVLQATVGDVEIVTFQGESHMMLTYPMFKRARQIVWVITKAGRAEPFFQFDDSLGIPGQLVHRGCALILTTRSSANSWDGRVLN